MKQAPYMKNMRNGLPCRNCIKIIVFIGIFICSQYTLSANEMNLDETTQNNILYLITSIINKPSEKANTLEVIRKTLTNIRPTKTNADALGDLIAQVLVKVNDLRYANTELDDIIENVLLQYYSVWSEQPDTSHVQETASSKTPVALAAPVAPVAPVAPIINKFLNGIPHSLSQPLIQKLKENQFDDINRKKEYKQKGMCFIDAYTTSHSHISTPYISLKLITEIQQYYDLLSNLLEQQLFVFDEQPAPSAWLTTLNMLTFNSLSPTKSMVSHVTKLPDFQCNFDNAVTHYRDLRLKWKKEIESSLPKLYYTGENHYWTNIDLSKETDIKNLQNAIFEGAINKRIIPNSSEIIQIINGIILAHTDLKKSKGLQASPSHLTLFFPFGEHGFLATALKNWIRTNPSYIKELFKYYQNQFCLDCNIQTESTLNLHYSGLPEKSNNSIMTHFTNMFKSLANTEPQLFPLQNVVMILDASELDEYGHHTSVKTAVNFFADQYPNDCITVYCGWDRFEIDKSKIFSNREVIELPPQSDDKHIKIVSNKVSFIPPITKLSTQKNWKIIQTSFDNSLDFKNIFLHLTWPKKIMRHN